MKEQPIYITKPDMERLQRLLNMLTDDASAERRNLIDLADELERAEVVDSKDIPDNVVTMNSITRLIDLDSGEERIVQLVFPSDADISKNRMSVLAPIGTALLGYRVGDVIEWKVPRGMKRLRIEEILYQPEAGNILAKLPV